MATSHHKKRPANDNSLTAHIDPTYLAGAAILLACLVWAYFPTLVSLGQSWTNQPDYSHGWFVIPIALWFLWIRREKFPADSVAPALYSGLAIVAASVLVRYLGARYFLGAVDGWSIVLWITGVVVALAGWRVLWWSLPSIAFLLFMIPMPYRLEHMFRQPLQHLATNISTAVLVMLGQPAIAEGNTIRIGEAQFGIVEACSGLRIFVGIVALAFVYLVVVQRSWLIKGLLLAAVLPVTLIANSTRIVVTCLLQIWVSGEASHRFAHDIAGVVMIPFAALLFGLVLWYLGLLIREVNVANVGEVIRHSASGELKKSPSVS
jgi:exosortase